MPKRSREQNSLRRRPSQSANAHIPLKRFDALLAPLLVRGEDDLGVGARPEAVAQRLELSAQLDVVEDLAVVEQLQRAVLTREWLTTAVAQVDDREPRVGEGNAFVGEESPSPSGPRCRSRASIARAASRSGGPPNATTPQIPHIARAPRRRRGRVAALRRCSARRRPGVRGGASPGRSPVNLQVE